MGGKRETLHPKGLCTRQHVGQLVFGLETDNGCLVQKWLWVIQGVSIVQLIYKASSAFISPRVSNLVGDKGWHIQLNQRRSQVYDKLSSI